MELVIIVLVSLALVPLVIFTQGALRIAFGLMFVLFFPGYTLIAALFPKKDSLGNIERLALSFGLSIAVVPLIGLILNYTPWGIRLYPILISVASFIVAMSVIAWYRRAKLLPEERFQIRLHKSSTPSSSLPVRRSIWNRPLTALLIITIIGAIGTLGYVIVQPKAGEQFTEFYILGLEGKAEDYPAEIILGEEGKVILGIVNHEYETTEYRVEITVDGEVATVVGPITLEQEEKWEQEVAFAPERIGADQKVEFLLYKGVDSTPYQPLHLWVDVKEAP